MYVLSHMSVFLLVNEGLFDGCFLFYFLFMATLPEGMKLLPTNAVYSPINSQVKSLVKHSSKVFGKDSSKHS